MASSLSRNSASIPPEVRMFFRDIKEHPDDDTPRLIFADWLQEHGDAAAAARGEFLRLQVLRHRLTPDDPNYGSLKRREGELFTEHRWTWLGPLVDAAKTWTFERGMMQITAEADKISTSEVTDWARTGAALWIDALTLTEMTIYSHGLRMPEAVEAIHDRLAYSPLLTHLNRLDLSGDANSTSLDCIIRATITSLDFLFRAIRAESLPCLRQLLLSHKCFTPNQISCLSRCRYFERFTHLDLQYSRLNDLAARILAESPHLRNGVLLLLSHNRFTTRGTALLREAYGEHVCF